ncbi:MAG: sigma-70 family RNA polymerase sigma factor [Actinomycetia bacterium]|nr:sigma-70 family RNA polymerase sigma factor [Actinomycetes bacterium]
MAEIVHHSGVVDLVEVETRLKRAFVARYGLDPGLDVAADALAWAWANQEQVAAADNPTGLLYRVGQSRARRYLRWKRRSSGSGYPPERDSERSVWVEPGLEAALTDLDIEQRTAVVLVHCFQWTYQEVADLLGVPLHTVRNRVHRGLDRLRVHLGAQR